MEKKYITTVGNKYIPCRQCIYLDYIEKNLRGCTRLEHPKGIIKEKTPAKYITNNDFIFGCDKGKLVISEVP